MATRPVRSSHSRPFSSNRTRSGTSGLTTADGRKYPEIKQRGVYSDILGCGARDRLGDVLNGPETAQDTLWNVAKEKHTPKATTFDGSQVDFTSEGSFHGPSTEITAVADFAKGSNQPKVQLQYFTPPGERPRKIEIERCKRHYAKQNLEELLQKNDIQTQQLMPKNQPNGMKNVKLNADPNEPAPFPPYLPLEIFDNTEHDCRTPYEWVEMGQENGVRKPVPGRALLPTRDDVHDLDPKDPSIEYKWFDVGMLDYDANKQLYLVQKVSGAGRIVDAQNNPITDGGLQPDGNHVLLPSQYWVPRVRLMFSAEDPEKFTSRVTNSFRDRKHTEALLRYHLYIDCMPMEGVGELDQASLRRMTEWAKGAPQLAKDKGLDDHIQVLEKEVNIDFCRSMNQIIFDKTVSDDLQTFAFVTVPERPEPPIPDKGCCLDVPEFPFDEQYDNFAFNSLLTREEAINGVGKVRTECNKVAAMSLFHIPTAKHMRLEEFEQAQSQATSQVSLFLKDSWISTLRAAIRTSLRDVGKGWFNIHETNWEVYQISKMKKFMEMVKFNMQDSLRYLVQDSLVNFTQMILDACHSTLNCEEGMVWGNNLIVSIYRPKRNALFFVDLAMDQQGVHYSTNLNSFESMLIGLFDRSIQSTQSVPQLEKYIMEDIFWSGTPLLESVGEHEPPVEELRENIRHAITMSLIPMKAYAKEYERYLELINIDINQYVRDYEAQNHTAQEVKQEVEMHLQEKEIVEGLVPSHIIIGPFYINTENMRQALSKKRKNLSNAVLELLARKLRKQADEVCEEFKSISRKLYDKPNCVEELSEMREWMTTIPDTLADKQELIDNAIKDYELIEEFYYSLSADDFNTEWSMIGWPHKIEAQMEQTETQLEEDEERFHKLQMSDQANFNDRLDTMSMLVAGMAAHTDINKAHEVANEVRRIHKQLKEAQTDAAKYNNRERLFGMPVTNYDKLNKLAKDFEPFRNLWITASDWLRWHDSWMNDPLTSIDAETVEKNVNEAYKTMHKSVKIFGDIPGVSDVAIEIKGHIEEFRPFIPLIQGLRNPGMRNRHWETV